MAGCHGFIAAQAACQHILAQKLIVGRVARIHRADDAAGGQSKSLNGVVVTQGSRYPLKFFNPAIRIYNQRTESFYFENKAQQFIVQIIALRAGNALQLYAVNLLPAIDQNPCEQ
ncbi:hypothetical protein [Desulfovibrio sp.]|uniref:hypothetical protein n=1 Tax=Desulfovibrio sp. TaxID=885 RepID=UPI0035AE3FAD